MTREEAINNVKSFIGQLTEGCQESIRALVPELRESEDERIRKELIEQVGYLIPDKEEYDEEGCVLPTYHKRIGRYRAWLEKQKEQKPKNILTNDDSLRTAYLKGQTDVLEDPEAFGLQKEQKHPDEHYTKRNALFDKCVENCDPEIMKEGSDKVDEMLQKEKKSNIEICPHSTKSKSYKEACKDVIVAIEKYLDWLTGYPDYSPKGKYSIRDMLYCLSILEKQKDINCLACDQHLKGYLAGRKVTEEEKQKE